jgi:hypothetical protein
MARRWIFAALVLAAALVPLSSTARDPMPSTWDNLVRIDSKKFAGVYVLPGADFRPYTKVMLDPTEVAFRKNWKRDYNSTPLGRISPVRDTDITRASDRARKAFADALAKAYAKAGYQVVTAPGADVLRVMSGVIDLQVSAPDTRSANVVRSYTEDAGQATVVIEARDSVTGAILGRAVDAKVAGDSSPLFIRNRASNAHDFDILFQNWADTSARGLAALKSMSPVPATPLRASE